MEAYSNCRQFNCLTPIVEQSEYHMFCREKAELHLPELYNKIGVGLMAWYGKYEQLLFGNYYSKCFCYKSKIRGPLSMMISENSERLLFSTKGSLKTKSQSYSWTEDEFNREVCSKVV